LISALAAMGMGAPAEALNPQPLPPGIYLKLDLNGAQLELKQSAVTGSISAPTVHTDLSFRFTPPDPCFGDDACGVVRGSFDVSASDVNLVRAAGLAAAAAGAACVDRATLSSALASFGATLQRYEPPDPCLTSGNGNPIDVAIAFEAAAGALGAGSELLPTFQEILGAVLPLPSNCPPAVVR
jgi:hypothetical protein